jgi:hypothetical protein
VACAAAFVKSSNVLPLRRLLCFIPDVNDAKPRTAHGMAKEFTIFAKHER